MERLCRGVSTADDQKNFIKQCILGFGMYRQQSRAISFQFALVLLCIFVCCSLAGLSNAENMEKIIATNSSSKLLNNSDPSAGISTKFYLPPPGIMPIVVLQGDPYEMGYQYGLQAKDYIAIVRDAAWASALTTNSSQEIRQSCQEYRNISQKSCTNSISAHFSGACRMP
jgi:hypothetical protein